MLLQCRPYRYYLDCVDSRYHRVIVSSYQPAVLCRDEKPTSRWTRHVQIISSFCHFAIFVLPYYHTNHPPPLPPPIDGNYRAVVIAIRILIIDLYIYTISILNDSIAIPSFTNYTTTKWTEKDSCDCDFDGDCNCNEQCF